MFARIFAFLLIISSLLLAPLPAFAQTPASPVASAIPYTLYPIPSSVSTVSPLYTDLVVHNLFHTFSCLAIGQSVIGQPCLTYQMTKNAQGVLQGVPVLSQVNTSGGVLGTTTNLIGLLYQNPPVRTVDYLASVGQGLGIVKEANAQGVGGSGAAVLNPILTLWQVSRNISYLALILIFLVVGLMVMFRNKLNPQTVITAQAALPGLVIGLIMITFSFFFAGLISDMAFVGTNVVGYYFAAAQGKLEDPAFADQLNLSKQISTTSSLSIFSQFAGIVTQDKAQNALATVFYTFSDEIQGRLRFFAGLLAYQFTSQPGQAIPVIGQFVGPIIGLIGAGATANDPTAILGMLLAFVAMFVLLYAMLKLLLRLVNCYLTIIFLTFSAPFQLLVAALPGRQGIATGWILNMLANVLVFPVVIAVFYFVAFILGESFGPLKIAHLDQRQNGSFVPTAYAAQGASRITDTSSFPLFGGMDLDFINIILAFGALVALPSIPDIVIKAVGRAGQAGQMIGQEISGSMRAGQGYAGRVPSTIQGSAQSLATGIGGESTYLLDKEGNVKRFTTKPGGWQLGQSLLRRGSGSGGVGR